MPDPHGVLRHRCPMCGTWLVEPALCYGRWTGFDNPHAERGTSTVIRLVGFQTEEASHA